MKERVDQSPKKAGSIYTPPDFAELLASWAITNPRQTILDIGVGEGSVAFAAYERLIFLGASKKKAQQQIYGTEIDPNTYDNFREIAKTRNITFPNIYLQDFFISNFCSVDTVIGNPPYVRRSKINNIDIIRKAITPIGGLMPELSSQTDLYVYFIFQACTHLKEGGRLAIITSDSWLNASYGIALKDYLKQNFEVESLISLDRNIFHAEVKALIILAVKNTKPERTTRFLRVKNGLPAKDILSLTMNPNLQSENVKVKDIKLSELSSTEAWGIQFKAPQFFEKVIANGKITTIKKIATTKIGIQTLAKEFFVLTPQKLSDLGLEKEYTTPLIQSNRNYPSSVIDKDIEPYHYLFYCDQSKDQLQGTVTLEYINLGETAEVSTRGKDEKVVGYQNKARIKRSWRTPWYNLKSKLEKRARAKILIPRVIHKTFRVYWNKANYVPGEFFIEFFPKSRNIGTEVYLAILSSSIFDICVRISAQLYGGGAYSIYPGQFKDVPVINPILLTNEEKLDLKNAFSEYLANGCGDRREIDKVIFRVLGWEESLRKEMEDILDDLIDAVNTIQKKRS